MVTSALARPVRGAALAACASVLALAMAACGGSGGKDADPAAAVPATAPFYAQATLRPTGKLGDGANTALKKILHTDDPGAKLTDALKSSDPKAKIDYQQDVEPWLGSRAGVFFTSLSGSEFQGAVVIASKDNGKAQDFIDKDLGGKAVEHSYNGVKYRFNASDKTAQGIVGDYVVAGSERGFRTVVDTVKGNSVATIDGDAGYKKALDAVGTDDALATAYVSTQGLIDAIARSGGLPPETLGGVRQAVLQAGGTASAIKLALTADALAIDTATLGVKQSSNAGAAGQAAAALQALPGDAWLGFGVGAVGEKLRKVLQQGGQVGGVAGIDVKGQLDLLQRSLGLDIQKDLLSWMGDAGVFVRGSTVADLGGALVVQSSDPTATKRAVAKLGRLVRKLSSSAKVAPLSGVRGADSGLEITPQGLPFPIVVAAGSDRFVVGVNPQAVEAALDPATTLRDSASFKQAAAVLAGVDPTFFLDIGPILRLADGLGAGQDPNYAKAREYLARFGAVAAGSKRDGDIQRGKLVLTLNG
jgi:hypothetical protein